MQTDLTKIWTRIAYPIFYYDNHYAMSIFFSLDRLT